MALDGAVTTRYVLALAFLECEHESYHGREANGNEHSELGPVYHFFYGIRAFYLEQIGNPVGPLQNRATRLEERGGDGAHPRGGRHPA